MKRKKLKISKNPILLIIIAIVISFSASHIETNNETNIYVSPQGNDANPGTKELPLASLNGAKNHVRKIKGSTKGDINVWIRGGNYYLNETAVFGLEDSGEGASMITYQAYQNEKPVFTSDVMIKNWKKIDGDIPGLPEAAAGNVWVAEVPKVSDKPFQFYTLYDTDGRLPRARSKGFIPTESSVVMLDSTDRDVIHFPEGVIKNWSNLDDIEIIVRPYQGWVMNILPLESVDEKAKIATTVFPATYLMKELHLLKGKESAWVENIMEAIDEPGEWVLNSKERKLYLWARNGKQPQEIMAPLLKEYIRVEGQVNKKGVADVPVRNLIFKGLTFMHGERYSYAENDKGLQHDWEMFDKDNALIRFRAAENCTVEQCHFLQSGGTAIRSDLYGQKITIKNNHIEHIGGTGVLLCGYGPGEKDVNKKNLYITIVYTMLVKFTGIHQVYLFGRAQRIGWLII